MPMSRRMKCVVPETSLTADVRRGPTADGGLTF